jgi:hypothetical protein
MDSSEAVEIYVKPQSTYKLFEVTNYRLQTVGTDCPPLPIALPDKSIYKQRTSYSRKYVVDCSCLAKETSNGNQKLSSNCGILFPTLSDLGKQTTSF